jgi:hypothetical protein
MFSCLPTLTASLYTPIHIHTVSNSVIHIQTLPPSHLLWTHTCTCQYIISLSLSHLSSFSPSQIFFATHNLTDVLSHPCPPSHSYADQLLGHLDHPMPKRDIPPPRIFLQGLRAHSGPLDPEQQGLKQGLNDGISSWACMLPPKSGVGIIIVSQYSIWLRL